jgi:hypothetical protein
VHHANAHRRQLVVQQRQLINVGGRQQVAPHGEHLPKFEEDEPQFLGGFSYLFRRRPVSRAEERPEKLVSGKDAQNLQESQRRSQYADPLRIDRYRHVILRTVMGLPLTGWLPLSR